MICLYGKGAILECKFLEWGSGHGSSWDSILDFKN